MPIPLNKLAGAELLPQNIEVYSNMNSDQIGYNYAVDDLGICAIAIDEEKLWRIVAKALPGKTITEIIQDIISQPEKFLKIVRVNDEVIK